MEDRIMRTLQTSYGFTEISDLCRDTSGGIMNEAYSFKASGKAYFLKSYSFYPDEKIRTSHALIKVMRARGIPTLTLVANLGGEYLTKEEGLRLEVTEFIDDAKNMLGEEVTDHLIGEMARGLAEFHRTLAGENLDLHFTNVFDPEERRQDFLKIRKVIAGLPEKQEADALCLEMTDLKLDYLNRFHELSGGIDFGSLPVCINHGDYLTGNCLFDGCGHLKYAIDLEHSLYTYRVWDVMKTSAFLARREPHEIFHSSIDPERLFRFIRGYHQANPLVDEEIAALQQLFLMASVLSDFVLYGTYVAHNETARRLMATDKGEWTWWIDNQEKLRGIFTDAHLKF